MCLILIMKDYLLEKYQLRQQRNKYEEKWKKKEHKFATVLQ